jgi:hypothetical protein
MLKQGLIDFWMLRAPFPRVTLPWLWWIFLIHQCLETYSYCVGQIWMIRNVYPSDFFSMAFWHIPFGLIRILLETAMGWLLFVLARKVFQRADMATSSGATGHDNV